MAKQFPIRFSKRIYFLISGVESAAIGLIMGIYALFLLKRGMSIFEVSMVNLAFQATMLIAEVPTGVLADMYGRRRMLIASYVVHILAFTGFAFSHSYISFALCEIASGIAITCANGAFDAWIVDQIKHHDEAFEAGGSSIFPTSQIIDRVCLACSSIGGAYLYSLDDRLPWIIGASLMIVSLVVVLIWMKEDYFVRTVQRLPWRRGCQIARSSIAMARDNVAIRFIIIVGIVQYFAMMAINMQWAPYFKQVTQNGPIMPFLFALMSGAIVTGTIVVLRSRPRPQAVVAWFLGAIVLMGVGMLVAAQSQYVAMILVGFLIYEVSYGMRQALKSMFMNSYIQDGRVRATVLSFESMTSRIGSVVGLIATGYLAKAFSIPVSWTVAGTVLVLGAVVLGLWQKRATQSGAK